MTAEFIVRALDAPDADLRWQAVVELLHEVLVLNDEVEGQDIAGGMDAAVSPGTAHQLRFLWIVRIGFGDGAYINERSKQLALNGLILVVDLQAVVVGARV